MPRPCTVCTHPDRDEIDRALLANAKKAPLAAKHRVTDDALSRHQRARHISARLREVREQQEIEHGEDLLQHVRNLRTRAISMLEKAENCGDLRTAMQGIREARGCIELLAKLDGQLDERPTVNVLLSSEWTTIRTTLLGALSPYPDARAAAAAVLLEVDNAQRRA